MHIGDFRNLRSLEYRSEVGDLSYLGAATHHMVEREHTMSFAATEGRLELDDRISVEPAHATQRLCKQAFHAFGHVGTVEEFNRVAIFKLPLTACNLRQISSELCLL